MADTSGTNRELIERFYGAFDRGDGQTMTECYAENARFHDPAFGELRGEEVGAMWRMLTSRATDLDIELRSHDADESSGRANWVATYTFAKTGRRVVNDITAKFRFAGGRIAEHDDHFDFGKWARQALGPAGIVIGVVPPLRAKVSKQARGQLEEFMAQERSGSAPGTAS